MLGADTVIACGGSHREMGLAQGRGARDEARAVYDSFLKGPELELSRPWYVPRALFPSLARSRAQALMEPAVSAHYPEQRERLEGIAEATGLSAGLLYMGLSAELLLNRIDWLPGACSAVAVSGPRAADGEAAIAKNFDYPPDFRVGFLVRESRPREGLASLDVTVAPLAGSHSGVNEAGLAVTYNYGYPQEEAEHPLPITLLVQRMLERCRTVAEAESLARETPRAGGALLTVADASGEAAVLELSPGRCAVRRAEEGVVAAANHYETSELAEIDLPHDAVYGPATVPALRGERVHRSSQRRREELDRGTSGRAPLTAADLERLLRSHGVKTRGDDDSLCRHGAYYETTCSVVLRPARRSLRVLFGAPCVHEFAAHTLTGEADAAGEAAAVAGEAV